MLSHFCNLLRLLVRNTNKGDKLVAMINNDIAEIQSFISKYWSIPISKLNSNAKLEDDLDIIGDDAVEFFNKFAIEFKVDLSDLDLKKYFESEGVGLLNFSWFFGKRRKIKRSEHEITIADLENVLKNGKWIDP